MRVGKQSKGNQEFEEGSYVAVASGTVDASGLVSTSIAVCKVLNVGLEDLLVLDDSNRYTSSVRYTVSKHSCTPISLSLDKVISRPVLSPQIGDMVLYHDKITWKSEHEEVVVGTVYEISYNKGRPSTASVMRGTEMMQLPYASLLVLQRAPGPNSV